MRDFTEALEKMARVCADDARYNAKNGHEDRWHDVPFYAVAVTLAAAYNKPDHEILTIHNRLRERAYALV